MKLTIDTTKLTHGTIEAILADLTTSGNAGVVAIDGTTVAFQGLNKAGKRATKRTRKAAPKAAAKPAEKAPKAKAAPKAKRAHGTTQALDGLVLGALMSESSVADLAAKVAAKKPHVAASLKRLRAAGQAFMAGVKRNARWGLTKADANERAASAKDGAKAKPKAAKRARKVAAHANGAATVN